MQPEQKRAAVKIGLAALTGFALYRLFIKKDKPVQAVKKAASVPIKAAAVVVAPVADAVTAPVKTVTHPVKAVKKAASEAQVRARALFAQRSKDKEFARKKSNTPTQSASDTHDMVKALRKTEKSEKIRP